MNPFSDIYKTLSPTELIRIVDDPDGYQPLAVEAASSELASRQLSEEETASLRTAVKNELEKGVAKKKSYEDKLHRTISAIVNLVDPIGQEKPSTSKIILATGIVFGLISAWRIFNEFGLTKHMLLNSRSDELFELVIYLILLILPLISAVLFWRRKKLGWIILAGFIIYSTLGDVLLLPKASHYRDSIPAIDSLFPTVSPTSVFLALLFHVAFLYILLKKDIRSVFYIDGRALIQTTVLAAILTGMMMIL